ncbi:MAG: alpha/beta hydrolase family protein [Bacillota bacterium]|nr:alpha/beta hydrolase family protein [Bacillota bacterium]
MARFRGDIYSESIGAATQLNIILPEASEDVTPIISGEPGIMYLLHGLGANASEWTRFSKIEYYAKKYNFIVVMPEVQRSFYTDAAYGPKYFTYIADELPQIMDTWFKIPSKREKTFICGESMGGYGAVKVGLSRPERFGGIGALSGALDFKRLIKDIMDNKDELMGQMEMKGLLGEKTSLPDDQDAIELVKKAAKNPDRPKLIQLCGTEDFLYGDNLRFRDEADASGYGHVYMEWPGEHSWVFWDVAVQRVFQYFCGLDHENGPIF